MFYCNDSFYLSQSISVIVITDPVKLFPLMVEQHVAPG